MKASQQLKEIENILNLALVPTIRIDMTKDSPTEYSMTQAERVKWLVNELQEKTKTK